MDKYVVPRLQPHSLNSRVREMIKKAPGLGQKALKYKKPLFGTGQRKFKKRNVRKRNKSTTKKRKGVSRDIRRKRT